MDFETKSVLIDREALELVKVKVSQMEKISQEPIIKEMAKEIIELLDKKNSNKEGESFKEETLLEQMKRKMKSTKDKDLNLKLYILYRKLEEKKISEEDALRLYEMYLDTEYTDEYI